MGLDFIERGRGKGGPEQIEILKSVFSAEYGLSDEESKTLLRYLRDLELPIDVLIGKRVLDIGCGPQPTLKSVVAKIGLRSTITNLDHSPKLGDAIDICVSADNLPFPDESFDLVLARASVPIMQAIPGKYSLIPRTLKEMLRVLKRGGVIKIYPLYLRYAAPGQRFWLDSYLGVLVEEELARIHKSDPGIKMRLVLVSFQLDDYLLEIYK